MTDAIRVSELVRRSAERWPRRIAVEDPTNGRRLTYGDLWEAVERGASALRRRGLRPGDRVLLAAPAGPSWVAALLAIAHADLVAVPIPTVTPASLARLAAMHTGACAWIGRGGRHDLARALADLAHLTADDLVEAVADRQPPLPVRPGATAVVVFTSGSTAHPRAVRLSHEGLRANLRSLCAARSAEPGETLLSTLPPSHAYELVSGQLAPLSVGARVVYGSVPLPNRLVDALRTHAVTRAVLVPALLEALLRDVLAGLAADGLIDRSAATKTAAELAATCSSLDAASVARIREAVRARIGATFGTAVVGGAGIDPAWWRVCSTFGLQLDVGYGLTEAGPVVTVGRAGECPAGSVGRPLPGVEVTISAVGEVLVRSDAVMQGYVGDPVATAAAFDGAWLRTGDRGRLDDEGHLFITGRIKEAMVTAAGETIYPDEAEPYYASSALSELAVVPGPGPDGNDRPTLVAVPADPSADVAVVEQAMARCRAAAPPRLRVAAVVVRTAPLPRTAAGKVRRRLLADELRRSEAVS